jgi:hypothetical protein
MGDHMKKKQPYTDTGDRFDRSLAYEEIGFTDMPFNLTVIPARKRNRRNSSRKYQIERIERERWQKCDAVNL